MKYDLLTFWKDCKKAIASADGAIAAVNFVCREGLSVDGVSHIAAVAVCVVRSEVGSGHMGWFRATTNNFRLLVFWLCLFPTGLIQFQFLHGDALDQTDL